ncbi:MAG: serine/threonine protein kinase [Chloroflexi bacterium]|nr:MAG: serine/threonine protein kinase [Chloroflexota bacterium]
MAADLELQERLGRGGMTEVWKAYDPQLQRSVAVKIFHADLLNDPDFMTRFRNLPRVPEAKLIASLQHPNIVRMYGFHISPSDEEEETLAYIVMDYVDGPTFAEYLRNTSYQKAFPSAADVTHLFASIAATIDFAHQQGVIHGDLKPSNILLDKHNTSHNPMGEPMLTDFGITSLLGTSTGAFNGKELYVPFYISSEQAQGNPATERSDIYALGVMLYETFTGNRPFRSSSPAIIREQQINTEPPPPTRVNPEISPAIAAVIMRSLAKNPEERYPSAASMVTALSEALNISDPEIISQSGSPADAMNGQANLSSTESTVLPDLVPSTVSSSSQSSIPMSNGQVVPATPAPQQAAPGEEGGHSESPASAFTHVATNPSLASVQASPRATSPVSAPAPPTPSPAPSQASPDTTSPASPPPSPSSQVPVVIPPPEPVKPGRRRGPFKRNLTIAIIVLLILLLVASTLVAIFAFPRKQANTTPAAPTTIPVVGHVYFLSSGKLYLNNNQGIYDEVFLDLHNIAAPDPGKSYYAWLLSDSNKSDMTWVALGKLSVTNGKVSYLYPGLQTHVNLLIDYSRLLITEEDASGPSLNPVLAPAAWRYYGQIYQLPSPKDLNHFSLLDHLRHLLVQAPELTVLGFPGGLSIWLMRNVEELLRWSVEAKDRFLNTIAVRGLLVNILFYLDGECAPADFKDAPAGTPTTPPNATIAHIARFALVSPCLQEQQQQVDILKQVFRRTPHDFIDHLLFHLNGVVKSPGTLGDLNTLTIQLNTAVTNVKKSLTQLRQDALQLVHMTDQQLAQPSAQALVGDMALQARYAYAGQPDPVTGNTQGGATWVYNNVQRLATFEVTPYSSK